MNVTKFVLFSSVSLLSICVAVIVYPVLIPAREKSRPKYQASDWPFHLEAKRAMEQAEIAYKRGDYTTEEKYIKQTLSLDYNDMSALNLMRQQERRGEYADALVTMRLIMNPIDPTHNPGSREILGRFSRGSGNQSRYSTLMDSLNYLLQYEALCRKSGQEQESEVVWSRVLKAMNDNATLGKGWIESPEGRKLTKAQLRELAKQTIIMSDVDAKSPKKIAAARTILRIAPQCEPARKWLANKLYAERYAKKEGAANLREAEQNYKALAHASDAATRKEAGETLQEIADHRAAVAGHGPVYAELDFAYSRHRLIRKVNGKVVEEHYLP